MFDPAEKTIYIHFCKYLEHNKGYLCMENKHEHLGDVTTKTQHTDIIDNFLAPFSDISWNELFKDAIEPTKRSSSYWKVGHSFVVKLHHILEISCQGTDGLYHHNIFHSSENMRGLLDSVLEMAISWACNSSFKYTNILCKTDVLQNFLKRIAAIFWGGGSREKLVHAGETPVFVV